MSDEVDFGLYGRPRSMRVQREHPQSAHMLTLGITAAFLNRIPRPNFDPCPEFGVGSFKLYNACNVEV